MEGSSEALRFRRYAMNIKGLYLLFGMILALFLSSCGDDDYDSRDIQAAKKLFRSFSRNVHVRHTGYVDQQSLDDSLEAAVYGSELNSHHARPKDFYIMRHIGCLSKKRKRFLTEEDLQTAADIIVGVVRSKVYFIQNNELARDHCYMAHLGIRGNISINGMPIIGGGASKGFGKLPEELCSSGIYPQYQVSRVDASQVRREMRESLHSQGGHHSYRQRYSQTSHWYENEDAYYYISQNPQGMIARNNKFGSARRDSFKATNHHEGLFVSAALRSNSSHPSCVKDVYWGYKVQTNNVPYITIDKLHTGGRSAGRSHGRTHSGRRHTGRQGLGLGLK